MSTTATSKPSVQPEARYFEVMEAHSQSHWWYRARWELVAALLRSRLPRGEPALDLGCGAGEMLRTLTDLGARPAVGTDVTPAILTAASGRAPSGVAVASADRLPFATDHFGCVIGLDVIEHLDSDVAALRECRRILRPGGLLLLTVPSYESLWSEHDDWAAHRRRYNRRTLLRVVRLAGFDVEWISYFNSFLVPPAWLVRRTPLRRVVDVGSEEETSGGALADALFGALSRLERRRLARRTLPIGLSLGLVASVPG